MAIKGPGPWGARHRSGKRGFKNTFRRRRRRARVNDGAVLGVRLRGCSATQGGRESGGNFQIAAHAGVGAARIEWMNTAILREGYLRDRVTALHTRNRFAAPLGSSPG